ncbi:MAG: FecR family protein [Treponema sp.]|jgi:hypothetical protein|nr:FecR family protein [Treponema sp.]
MKKTSLAGSFRTPAGLCKKLAGLLFFLAAGLVFSQEALIRETAGTVEVKEPGAADWASAKPGQGISRNTTVSTGFKSSAVIEIGNSVLIVQPLTRLTVDELEEAGGNERINLNLRTGRVRADVKPPLGGKTEFVVKSPTATASVRGTMFEFNGIQLRVDEGRVHLSGGDHAGTYVGAGHQVQTDTDTGRTASVEETAREELSPPLPAGINSAPEAKPAVLVEGDMDIGFDWR